ncbi:POU domain class 2-associating factor 2 [Dasypus novemcinctus]|uniref:POU domain class 2-associating factor 2 n=1 Tax=Dasypus novemcinctus TaxID=9361 RepID=UPI00265E39CA|nr:POU domain class 2-associating factor 2 [Dasypus novemcinctus]
MESVPGDFSKRVYQGVRVKHTVKDLLAEKRSRQTNNSRFNGSVNSSQSPFVPMPGSPLMSGYYGVRRSFLSDSDFHNAKQFPSDIYTSSVAKRFSCDATAGQSYPGALESYLPEPYGDYRSPALPPSSSSLFSASPLPPLLPPPFPSDASHFVFRDSWEQTVADGLSQPEPAPADALQPLAPLEDGAPAARGAGWGPGAPYALPALEELAPAPGFPAPPPYAFPPFVPAAGDLAPKLGPLAEEAAALPEPAPWSRDDALAWGPYEGRRAY